MKKVCSFQNRLYICISNKANNNLKNNKMTTSIKLQIKSVYGNEMIYPACETSKTLANLTRKKTLDNRDLEMIKSLGYVIEWVNAYQRA